MIRPLQDNCLLVLEPDLPEVTASGLHVVQLQEKGKAYGNRIGRVVAVGPGHFKPVKYRHTGPEQQRSADHVESTAFEPTSVKPGERVVVLRTAGDPYAYTKRQDFADAYGAELDAWGIPRDSAEWRAVREAEILAVIESSEVREGSVAAE